MKKKFFLISVFVLISLVFGILSNDILIGGTILLTALLCTYYSSNGKSINYLFGIINNILVGYVGFINGLFGYFIFNIFIFFPLQIVGYLSWINHKDDKNEVVVREFNFKNSIIITISCILGSFVLAYFLKLIPAQQMALMDAASVILNLCAFILMMKRYKECWFIWFANNIIDLVIWIVNFVNNGQNSIMMLVVSITYLLINIYGIIMWKKKVKK